MTTDLEPTWRVRPGRECRYCGEIRLGRMKIDRNVPDQRAVVCRLCAATKRRERRAALPEKEREGARTECRARVGVYREQNRDKVREAARFTGALGRERFRARTPEEVIATRDRLRPDGLKHCRKCREWLPFDAYYSDNARPDGLGTECRTCNRTRLLRRALPSWEDRDLWACVYCGAPFEHVEHVWPSSDGGPDDPRNLAPACAPCNLSKHDADVLDFVERAIPGALEAVASWPVRVVEVEV